MKNKLVAKTLRHHPDNANLIEERINLISKSLETEWEELDYEIKLVLEYTLLGEFPFRDAYYAILLNEGEKIPCEEVYTINKLACKAIEAFRDKDDPIDPDHREKVFDIINTSFDEATFSGISKTLGIPVDTVRRITSKHPKVILQDKLNDAGWLAVTGVTPEKIMDATAISREKAYELFSKLSPQLSGKRP